MFCVSSVHDVSDLISTLVCACLSHAPYTVHARVDCQSVVGSISRVSREGDKWGRGFSFVLALPSCLLYSDGCSQSVLEEAESAGESRCPQATKTWPKYVCVCVRDSLTHLSNVVMASLPFIYAVLNILPLMLLMLLSGYQ